ncbi:MAG: hypothetical protein FJ313_03605 [Gemmatimonadetes bacterium]|nr:hypothetical protein [Gemmatimonadota bacterium]
MSRRLGVLSACALAVAMAAGAAACSSVEPTPGPTAPLSRRWELVGIESAGSDLVVSVRLFAPVELSVLLDGGRPPDESSVPAGAGIASFRFRGVADGDHSVKVTDGATGISRAVRAGPPPVVAQGAGFVLKVGEKARVGEAGPLVTFKGVPEDSRCPTDAWCAQAGEAAVELAIDGAGVRVRVPRKGEGTESVAGYSITVSGLEPLPSTTRNIDPEQYRATFRVEAR